MTAIQRRAAFWLVVVFLAAYVAPVTIVSVIAVTRGISGQSGIGQFFVSLLSSPTGFASLLQKLLIPLTAGLSAAVLWAEEFGRKTLILVALATLGIICALFLLLYLNETPVAAELWQWANVPAIHTAAQFGLMKDQYLSDVLTSLVTYLAVLMGVQAAPSEEE